MAVLDQFKYSQLKRLIENAPGNNGAENDIDFERLDTWVHYILHEKLFDLYIDYCCFKKKNSLIRVVNHIEKMILTWALMKFGGNRRRVARYLSLDYSTVLRKIKKHELSGVSAELELH